MMIAISPTKKRKGTQCPADRCPEPQPDHEQKRDRIGTHGQYSQPIRHARRESLIHALSVPRSLLGVLGPPRAALLLRFEMFTHAACLLLRGGRSLTLSESRLKSLSGRSHALPPVGRAGRSRWSPSSGRTFFRYFGGDGGSTYAAAMAIDRLLVHGRALGSTTRGFRLRARSSSSMRLGVRNAARLAARQRKKYRSGWCRLMFSFSGVSRPRAIKTGSVRPRNGTATWQRQ